MCQVPLLPDKQKKGASDAQEDDEYRGGRVDVYLPGIHKNKADLTQTETYASVIKNFKSLDIQHMLCLLSFAVFPENGVMNKTMLMYWWMAEGFLPVEDAGTSVAKILEDFKKMGLIEPVEDERKMEPASYKMPPLVHSAVVRLSTSVGLFDIYDEKGKPAMKKSEKKKVCLVEGSSSKDETKITKMQPGDIETVFNVSERFPDFTFKWFKLMKTLKVLYLGRWERTAKRHIEVESPELMKNLNSLSELRLLSLQGISRIERLDDSVCKLRKLIILDLRACYNLEKLPEKIDSLENLIYLDISECYMIDRMPKRLAWLEKLEVLKGFVVSDADEETTCRLIDLKHLERLKKLSVTINKTDFDVNKLKEALVGLKALENLKVAWGGISKDQKEKKTGMDHQAKSVVKNAVKALFRQHAGRHGDGPANPGYRLHKLDLQCFPDAELPEWLQPRNLITLKKLYIKGGTELSGLGELPTVPTHCGVEVLRLKFLPKLQVEWRDLKGLYFPKMELLEKYQCPRVALCPCDGKGIWKVNKP
ncbi:PREDICTED: disease resistance RPP13-like protein 4 [Tarenaya hassleriana]|nr:PREDICTED: disease resistance RPP13-like protein 4 [Tarenaya hassleriana]